MLKVGRIWSTMTPLSPLFFVSVVFKRLNDPVSSLSATLTRAIIYLANQVVSGTIECMQSTYLAGVRHKIDWAKHHLDHFDEIFGAGIGARQAAHSAVLKQQSEGHGTIPAPEPPVEWRLIIGDAVSNMRASLDHLACQLALRVREECCHTEFPIFSEETPETARRFKKLGKFIGTEAVARIQFFQPYKRDNSVADDIVRTDLHRLATLDNINKHRLLIVVEEWTICQAADITVDGRTQQFRFDNPPWQRLKDRTETIFQIVLQTSDGSIARHDAPPPKVDVNPHYALAVAFNGTEGICDNMPVVQVLRRILASTTMVIDSFGKQFFGE